MHNPDMNTYSIQLNGITVEEALNLLKKDPWVIKAEADFPYFFFNIE
jgi:hypothetical protein